MNNIMMSCILTSAVTAYLTAKVMAIHYLDVIDRHTKEMTELLFTFSKDLINTYVDKGTSKGGQ